MKFKKIGVLTSGGDAPGMNAAVRAVVNAANSAGVKTVGFKEGYQGLMDDEKITLTNESVANLVGVSGTALYTARALGFKTESGMEKAIEVCKRNGIDGLVVIGGDGTFRGANDLSSRGIHTIGIPGTIDNDITATDYTIGFDTAMNSAISSIEMLRNTSESHARCSVVELMGRGAGHIAIRVAIAVGAFGVLIPEAEFDEASLIERMRRARENGQRSFIIVVSEGVKATMGEDIGERLSERIEDKTGIETRFARLAHVIRGGLPTLRDRLTASLMGEAAVKLLLEGKSNLVVCERNSEIVSFNINYALAMDRMYKNSLRKGDLDPFTEDQIKKMREFTEMRQREIAGLYQSFVKMA